MKKRTAFSMLELMIALVLLGVLSALAWSILDNFRSAEQRGWKVASRLQSIRSARLWLEEDLSHLSEPLPQLATTDDSIRVPIAFQGSATGFSITYAPSIDPLPWLEELVLSNQDAESNETTSLNRYTRLGLYRVEATYQLQGDGMLVRTLTSQAPTDPRNNSTSTIGNEPIEPKLTVNDLYRQSERVDEPSRVTSNSSQSRLGPLYRPRFRFHDGSSWKSTWVATSSLALPTAIELSFDLDNFSQDLSRPATSETATEESVQELPDSTEKIQTPVVELDEDVAEAMLQEPRQIRMVVKLPWVDRRPTGASSSSFDPSGFRESASRAGSEFFQENAE